MRFAFALPLALLSACSGSGGGGSAPAPAPTPTPANGAPGFTSAATATLVENQTAAYQATATDPDGNTLTFTIAGGADAARFAITASGALSFTAAPNFELPADADADNVYAVQLRVSDGSAGATLDLAVTVSNSREGIRVRRVGTGFSQPIHVAAIPGSSDVFVIEKTGAVYRLDPATGVRTLVLTVGNLSTDGERGLLGMALRTAFATNGEAFFHVTRPDGAIEVREYRIGNPGFNAPTGYRVLLTVPHPGANNHNGGWIGFGPDGNLYVATGDGGGAGDPGNNAQNTSSRLGKILRLGESGGGWGPAPGNPFLAGGGDPLVFAYGLRNPFRAAFGPDGRLYIGDVGQGAVEEIDVVRPDQPGLNFGWRFREGTQVFTGTPGAGLTLIDPVSQYLHGTGPSQGSTVIGGYVYRGPIASLRGSYIFADYISGNIWSIPAASLVQGSLYPAASYERRNPDFAPDAGTIADIVSFGEDDAGNLYIVDIGGEIFAVVPE